MIVPVYWVSLRDGILARSYWDQAMVPEALFAGRLGRLPSTLDFQHFELIDDERATLTGGVAVFVIPARHHVNDVERLNTLLAGFDGVLVILTGDEEGVFPAHDLRHDNLRCWVQNAHDRHHDAYWFGCGWAPHLPALLAQCDPGPRIVPVSFAGQVTHDRRRECVKALAGVSGAVLVTSEGFTEGLPHDKYAELLASSKVVACPSGPVHPDSFRVYEALEAGCVPLVDNVSPRGVVTDYWTGMWGAVPFPLIEDWTTCPDVIAAVLEDWPAVANRCGSWWGDTKRRMARSLVADLESLGVAHERSTVGDRVTVLMPTSPASVHPSTADIETTIGSIRERLPDCEIIVMADGLRPDQDRPDYTEYLRRLLWKAQREWSNVLVLVFDEYLHQAARTRRALEWVDTPLVFFVEHDTPLVNETDFAGICRVIESGEANLVRLHHEASVLEPHEFLMVDHETQTVDGVPLRRTADWSQRPHIASTEFYRHLMSTYVGTESRTFIETVMYGVLRGHWEIEGEAGWARFKTWLYTPETTMQRSIHIDSRRGDPLSPEVFAYDGETPEHAPNPHHLRDEAT